ncbi:hlyD secretion family protein, partial [Vibrio parahaemolyticus VP2007-007]
RKRSSPKRRKTINAKQNWCVKNSSANPKKIQLLRQGTRREPN